jgi:hypothetical protein
MSQIELLVTGSPCFGDYGTFMREMDSVIGTSKITSLILCGIKSIDDMTVAYGKARSIPVISSYDLVQYECNNAAERSKAVVDKCTHLIAFFMTEKYSKVAISHVLYASYIGKWTRIVDVPMSLPY